MNSLVTQDFLINQHEIIYQFFESLLFNSFIILVLIDYIVHRFQTLGKIKMLEKMQLDNQTQIAKAEQIATTFCKFEERIIKTTENCEKGLEEYKDCNRKLLDGLCRGIDAKLLEINFQIQDGLDALEKKLKLLVNSELDKVDDGYDKLSRNLLLLQSRLSESCENNSDRMTNLEDTLNENYPHIPLLTDKIETLNQYVEDIKKNVFKVEQKYYELKEMMNRELDGMQEEYFGLYDECREKIEKSDEKMNEWSGSKLDSKICDLYSHVRGAVGLGEGIQRTIRKILEVNFPHIKFNETQKDVCEENYKLMNPNWASLEGY